VHFEDLVLDHTDIRVASCPGVRCRFPPHFTAHIMMVSSRIVPMEDDLRSNVSALDRELYLLDVLLSISPLRQ
jgi:hypothetical protein